MLVRTDTGPATPVHRYSCQGLAEPTEAPPWLRASRVARVDPHEVWLHSARSGCTVHALVALSNWVGMRVTASEELGRVGRVGRVRQLPPSSDTEGGWGELGELGEFASFPPLPTPRGAGEGLPPHRAGGGCNPPTGTRSQVRYVACSEGGSGPPESARLFFFSFCPKEIYFFCLSSLLSKRDKRHTTYLRGGGLPPGARGGRGQPRQPAFFTAQTSSQPTGRPRWSRLRS